jgi:iron complex transport system permease protein
VARLLEPQDKSRQTEHTDVAATAEPRPAAKRRGGLAGRRFSRGALALAALVAALFAAIVVGGAVGAVTIPPLHSLQILLNATHLTHFTPSWPDTEEVILLQVRLPRVAGAALVGAALGCAGTLFQGLLRNPLADPLLLGTSAGAALGATVAFLFPISFAMQWLGFSLIAVLAFAGALGAVVLVYLLATRRGRTPVVTLLLAGVVVNAISTAIQTLLITLHNQRGNQLISLFTWLSGTVDVREWAQLQVVGLLVVLGVLGALLLSPALDAFAVGEEMAGHLGLRVERAKLLIVAAASLLVAAAVSISGLVGFVGLVAPHVCRLTLGPRHRLLVPASALAGAIFVVLADTLARTVIAPTELPLGVVTALVGGPFFLWLLRSAGERYEW